MYENIIITKYPEANAGATTRIVITIIDPAQEEEKEESAQETAETLEPDHNPSIDEVADSLTTEIETRGGIVPPSTLHIPEEILKKHDEQKHDTQHEKNIKHQDIAQPVEEDEEEEEVEDDPKEVEDEPAVPPKKEESKPIEKDPLDELITNLNNELNDLKSQLGGKKKKK